MIDGQAVTDAKTVIMQALGGELDGNPGIVTAASTILIVASNLQVVAELKALQDLISKKSPRVTVINPDEV